MTVLFELPKLAYGYGELTPFISEEQLRIHHSKHHQAYVNAANELLQKLETARKENSDLDMKATLKALSFNIAGHELHSLFWENICPPSKAQKQPSGELLQLLNAGFGSIERFKKEFSQAATTTEGSGWAALAINKNKKLFLMQIEKHNVNIIPETKILLVLDVWEHAYYLDYKNERPKFVEAFWNIVNWPTVEKRLEEAKQ
jgi:Fe-Mn family superoxide dismutase